MNIYRGAGPTLTEVRFFLNAVLYVLMWLMGRFSLQVLVYEHLG